MFGGALLELWYKLKRRRKKGGYCTLKSGIKSRLKNDGVQEGIG